jgi:Flp pilus assembly protein TadD
MTKPYRHAIILGTLLFALFVVGCGKGDTDRAFRDGTEAFHQERWQDAVGFFSLVEEKAPGQVSVLMLRGISFLKLGLYTAAKADFSRILDLQPENTEARKGRGEANLGLGRYAEAAGDFARALTVEPDDIHTLNNRGFALSNLGDFEAALADFDTALQKAPDNPPDLL